MARKSSRTGQKRNVSETTLSSSIGIGSLAGDCDNYWGKNPTSERERGRYCSSSSLDSDSEDNSKTLTRSRNSQKPKCFSKNAILARQNRIKKKKYLEDLENEVKELRAEIAVLRVSVEAYSKNIEVLTKENRYLRNVLASREEISRLLGVIRDKTGLVTSSSLCKTGMQGNRSDHVEANGLNSFQSPAPINDPPVIVPHQSNPEISAEGECVESPITFTDPILFGTDCGEEPPIPPSLFSSDDHEYLDFNSDIPEDWLAGDEELPNVGVCLHVAKKKVSLEFCQYCNENASQCWGETLAETAAQIHNPVNAT